MEVLNKEKVLDHAKRLIGEGKADKAIIEYKKLLEIDPKDMRIKLRIAELLARQKKIGEAVEVYNEVADSYTDDGFYLKAVTVYKNVLRLNPSLVGINYKLAELYEKMGLNKDAILQYQILSSAYEQKNRHDDLVEVRRKIVELDPHNISNRVRLAETYQYEGEEDAAMDEYEKIVNDIKGEAKPEQLIELYGKILSYRPDNVDMMRALSNIYYKRGEWKQVVDHLDKKDELLADQPDMLLMQADVYGRLNQVETAKNKYKQVADIFISTGQVDKAIDAYREMLVLSADNDIEVKELLDEIDEDLFENVKREAEEKRKKLEEIAERAAAEGVSESLDLPEEEGGKEINITLSGQEIKKMVSDAESAFELGKAYHQMGLKEEATPELEKCLRIYNELVNGGYSNEDILGNRQLTADWLGLAHPEEGKPTQTEPKKVEEKGPDDTVSTMEGKGGPEDKKEAKEKKKGAKKKDKRMGFV